MENIYQKLLPVCMAERIYDWRFFTMRSLIFLLGLNLQFSLAAVNSCNHCGLLDSTFKATISKHFTVLFHL